MTKQKIKNKTEFWKRIIIKIRFIKIKKFLNVSNPIVLIYICKLYQWNNSGFLQENSRKILELQSRFHCYLVLKEINSSGINITNLDKRANDGVGRGGGLIIGLLPVGLELGWPTAV